MFRGVLWYLNRKFTKCNGRLKQLHHISDPICTAFFAVELMGGYTTLLLYEFSAVQMGSGMRCNDFFDVLIWFTLGILVLKVE